LVSKFWNICIGGQSNIGSWANIGEKILKYRYQFQQNDIGWQGRNQGEGRAKGASKSKLKNKKFKFSNFLHTTRSKCYCNTITSSQLSNFIELGGKLIMT